MKKSGVDNMRRMGANKKSSHRSGTSSATSSVGCCWVIVVIVLTTLTSTSISTPQCCCSAWTLGSSTTKLSWSSLSPSPSPRLRSDSRIQVALRGEHEHEEESSSSHTCIGAQALQQFPITTKRRDALWRLGKSISMTVGLGTSMSTVMAVVHVPSALAYTPDADSLRESLYLMSRVQEATVQQERLVNNPNIVLQEELKKKMTLSLRLVEKSYRVVDQINYASQFIIPRTPGDDLDLVAATTAGYEAADALQSAIDFVKRDLSGSVSGGSTSLPLKESQRAFLSESLQTTRQELFVFLSYMPQDKLRQARERVERENVDNRDEFDGPDDAGVYNPVKLPWK
jgi:hypothetical protein